MDSTLTGAWIGVVAGFVLWVLNLLWLLYSDNRKAERIRTMINVEINDNLNHIRNFLQGVEQTANAQAQDALQIIARHDAFKYYKLPPWNRRVWDSLTESIPLALTPEQIERTYNWYNQLEVITTLEGAKAFFGSEVLWVNVFETKMKELLSAGNPLDKSSKALMKSDDS